MNVHQDQRRFSYSIDRDHRIVAGYPMWTGFERTSGCFCTTEEVLDRPLWSLIADQLSRRLYRDLIFRIRDNNSGACIPYRCDSLDTRRFLEIEISSGDDGERIDFSNRILRTERRRPIPLLDPSRRQRSGQLLSICSWCNLVQVPDRERVEVEEAIEQLSLFDTNLLPQLNHDICESCATILKSGGYKG